MHDPHTKNDVLENALDDNENKSHQSSRIKIDFLASKELNKRLAIIDEEIIRLFESERGDPEVLYDTALHLLQAGGKHVRSLLTALSCEAVGGSFNEALPFAVATEFVQTASLIHDDVIDDDEVRRGVESTHLKFGTRMAIIAGDLLVARAVKLVSENTSRELLKIVATSGIQMCEGEASDILMYVTTDNKFTTENYFEVVRRKTVAFMRAATKVGAFIGKATEEQLDILDTFGELMGFAFQIRDDILDIIASENSTGKSVLSDLKGIKTNYVLVHALENSSQDEVAQCIKALQNHDVGFAMELIKKSNSIEQAKYLAYDYAVRAKEAIRNKGFLNEELLCALADYAYDRDF